MSPIHMRDKRKVRFEKVRIFWIDPREKILANKHLTHGSIIAWEIDFTINNDHRFIISCCYYH